LTNNEAESEKDYQPKNHRNGGYKTPKVAVIYMTASLQKRRTSKYNPRQLKYSGMLKTLKRYPGSKYIQGVPKNPKTIEITFVKI
jgi:hypothetical protein